LLSICNSQAHKKFQVSPAKGSGADSYREWQISYQFIIGEDNVETGRNYRKYLSDTSLRLLKDYMLYNESAENAGNVDKSVANPVANGVVISPTYFEFYRHKIYATSAVSTFFTLLLTNFKKNGTHATIQLPFSSHTSIS
jgi:hypothetical protein